MAKKTLTSPKGVAVWPKVNRPDTKFNADGVYTVDLRLEGKTAETFKAIIDAHVTASYDTAVKDNPKAKKSIVEAFPYKAETDEEGDDTGATLFRFKRNAVGKNGKTGETWTNKVKLFDAKGNPCAVIVGGGSDLKVSFTIRPYYMSSTKNAGVTLDLLAVQIIKLVQGGSAESYGFGEEEGWEDDGSADATQAETGETAETETETPDEGDESDGKAPIDF